MALSCRALDPNGRFTYKIQKLGAVAGGGYILNIFSKLFDLSFKYEKLPFDCISKGSFLSKGRPSGKILFAEIELYDIFIL